MRLSKHHYAEALATLDNEVFFLEPASISRTDIKLTEIRKNLHVVNYPLKAKGWGKLPGFIYKFLVHREMKMLVAKLGEPDLVWCFDPIKLVHLSSFKKAYKIYHPVDQFDQIFLNKYRYHFDIAFSTMQKETDLLKCMGYKAHFIQHGLSKEFEPFARKRLLDIDTHDWSSNDATKANIGFAGNLLGDALDRDVMREVIENNPDCQFHFWGKYENNDGSKHINERMSSFIEFLKSKKYVTLYGAVSTSDLAHQMQSMDMFWVYWKKSDSTVWNAHTNPHKIVEYLSTGMPVISHFMHTYKDSNLLYMMEEQESGSAFIRLFQTVKSKLQHTESGLLKKQRIQYALENLYDNQVSKIASYIRGEQ